MIIAIKIDGTSYKKFRSQMEAAKELNLDVGNVNYVLKGILNQTGGYTFLPYWEGMSIAKAEMHVKKYFNARNLSFADYTIMYSQTILKRKQK